ncbi:MAG: NAD(P)H-dependent oxidoreductase subunit E, partial [Victivallales bacterium]|nr:NAD(P)H-dependent oxidoreductase subunit E [Victivallales bacterium]
MSELKLNSVIAGKKELEEICNKLISKNKNIKKTVSICCGTGCIANNSLEIVNKLQQLLKSRKIDNAEIKILKSGCPGYCEQGPLVKIMPDDILYTKVTPEDAEEIINETIINNKTVERLLFKENGDKTIQKENDIPFYKKQNRILLGLQSKIDYTSLEDYISINGYQAAAKAFSMKPDNIIGEIVDSGLRGRGGAGFPTGRKWEQVKKQDNTPKYIVCNADEGDPGAFMDRAVLEGNPHLIIEGLIIGGYAMGAEKGYVYVRDEYPLAVKNLKKATDAARKVGLLGKNILGSGFNFDIVLYRGAGAFVCGESSALIKSIMGMAGEPKQKIPRNSVKGLWNKPTNINNVETWANVPNIINYGSSWFAEYGNKSSKGTKIFALVGKINNTGLVEVPMGITLREVINDIGGGIPEGKKFKAVQTGGPSGGCLPDEKLDLPIDFDSLDEAGAIMGSGGMIVMDENTCMVDVAKYFTDFNLNESCGKCTSCREGLSRLSEILERIIGGKGKEDDLLLMEELSEYIISTSLCG